MTQQAQPGQLTEIVDFLLDYPVERRPYPKHFPEELMGEVFPGKDYVIGMCDEAIDNYMDTIIETKNPIIRDIASMGVDIFKDVKLKRLKKLHESRQTVYKTDEIQEMINALL